MYHELRKRGTGQSRGRRQVAARSEAVEAPEKQCCIERQADPEADPDSDGAELRPEGEGIADVEADQPEAYRRIDREPLPSGLWPRPRRLRGLPSH